VNAEEHVTELIEKGRKAQNIFEGFSQRQVDEAVRAVGKSVYDAARPLAELAVRETGMGNVEDKIKKNMGKPKFTWQKIKHQKSRGIIRYIDEEGLVEVAKPMGVIGAIMPVTNPNMTPVHNAMVALKGGNAIIICPHPKGIKTGEATVKVMREALKAVGAPEDLVQIVAEASIEVSGLIMKNTDACISTGGPGVVKAAYSSGKPAYGVGPGNVQSLFDEDADIKDAVTKTITGRIYDNGVLCTCEQAVHVPADKKDEIVAEFKRQGAYVVTDKAEVDKFRNAVFPGGKLEKDVVGTLPVDIAKRAGVDIPADTKLIVIEVEKFGKDEVLAKEKLFPVLTMFVYNNWDEAVAKAATNVENEGTGHSCVIHSFTKEHVEQAAVNIKVSRVVVNQIGSNSLGGTLANGLNPTGTLGCGSWGGNSLSENLWWTHLVNISRIAYEIPDAPGLKMTDDELWAME